MFKDLFANGRICAITAGLLLLSGSVSAGGLFNFLHTKNEYREVFLVYDLPGFSGERDELRNRVREALSHAGDSAFIKDYLQSGTAPRYPAKLVLKPLGHNLPVSINIPSCNGAAFSIASSDNSMPQHGEKARFMACGFVYAGGYRLDFYAAHSNSSGGVRDLLAARVPGKVSADGAGSGSNLQTFVESTVARPEASFAANGWQFALVEMNPAIRGKRISADPLALLQASERRREADRSRRMAARVELFKLGIDASDQARFAPAVQAQDEDLIALFVEAGVVDSEFRNAGGRTAADCTGNTLVRNPPGRPEFAALSH